MDSKIDSNPWSYSQILGNESGWGPSSNSSHREIILRELEDLLSVDISLTMQMIANSGGKLKDLLENIDNEKQDRIKKMECMVELGIGDIKSKQI